jgi:predicted RNA-binding protein with TRAM domain
MNGHTKTFLIDTNILIEAHRQYYSFEICPGFWDSMVHHNIKAKIFSIDRVKNEITGTDALAQWVKNTAPKSLFCSTDDVSTVQKYSEIMRWVQSQKQFTDGAKEDFAKAADGWVIAYAQAQGYTVVTHEEARPNVKVRIPIPNICEKFNVEHLNTFDMLKILQTKFHWNRP